MAKKSTVLLLVLLVAFSALFFVGCNRVKTETGIEVAENSFKFTYDIDEEISYDNANLKLLYDDGSFELIPIEKDMVKNFHTMTTGTRAAVITYGKFSASYVYEVEYSSRPGVEINTYTRFALGCEESADGKMFSVNLITAELTGIYAVYFTLVFDEAVADAAFSEISVDVRAGGWDYIAYYIDSHKVRYLIFANGAYGLNSDGTLANISVAGNTQARLTDIVISDGLNDYDLPDTEGV